MGILDLFKGKKLPPGDVTTQKAGRKLCSLNTDIATRYQAADTLAKIGTEEALYCLLNRFTVVIGTQIPDEDEKKYVAEKALQFGDKLIAPLMKFIRDKEQVAQALDLLEQVCTREQFLDNLLQLVDDFDPYFSKYPDKKIQTFKMLQAFQDDRIIEKLEPFLDDDDDDIQMTVINTLAAQKNEEKTREMFLQKIIDSEERPRVRAACCDALSDLHWKVRGYKKQIIQVLPERFYLDSKGYIHRKTSH